MLPLPIRNAGQPVQGRDIPVTASCGGCNARWTDPDTTHCRICHATWQDLKGFDTHLAECQPGLVSRPRRAPRR
jgi:hypothetical protein